MSKNKIKLKIRNTESVLFEGEVDRISSFNEVGPFDIFPEHANFISLIRKGLSLYNDKKQIKQIEFEQAVLKIRQDVAKIFLGIEIIILDNGNINEPANLQNNK